eukprot:m.54770 g.54770  ORF g.54770 m.54770 type:complete len:148 (+) comp12893_c0_seq3:336-779(+)
MMARINAGRVLDIVVVVSCVTFISVLMLCPEYLQMLEHAGQELWTQTCESVGSTGSSPENHSAINAAALLSFLFISIIWIALACTQRTADSLLRDPTRGGTSGIREITAFGLLLLVASTILVLRHGSLSAQDVLSEFVQKSGLCHHG